MGLTTGMCIHASYSNLLNMFSLICWITLLFTCLGAIILPARSTDSRTQVLAAIWLLPLLCAWVIRIMQIIGSRGLEFGETHCRVGSARFPWPAIVSFWRIPGALILSDGNVAWSIRSLWLKRLKQGDWDEISRRLPKDLRNGWQDRVRAAGALTYAWIVLCLASILLPVYRELLTCMLPGVERSNAWAIAVMLVALHAGLLPEPRYSAAATVLLSLAGIGITLLPCPGIQPGPILRIAAQTCLATLPALLLAVSIVRLAAAAASR